MKLSFHCGESRKNESLEKYMIDKTKGKRQYRLLVLLQKRINQCFSDCVIEIKLLAGTLLTLNIAGCLQIHFFRVNKTFVVRYGVKIGINHKKNCFICINDHVEN